MEKTGSRLSLTENEYKLICNQSLTFKEVVFKEEKLDCATPEVEIKKPAIIELNGSINTSPGAKVTICLWSIDRDRCLNQHPILLSTNSTVDLRLLAREVFYDGDRLKVFVSAETPQGQTGYIQFGSLETVLYDSNETVAFTENQPPQLVTSPLQIHPGDHLSLHIPLLIGESLWRYPSHENFVPEYSTAAFDANLFRGNLVPANDGSLQTFVKEGVLSIYRQLPLFPTEGLGLIGFDATNEKGIPTDISLRHKKQFVRTFSRRIPRRSTSRTMELVLLPAGNPALQLEAYNSGIGPRESVNTLSKLVFQKIPDSWMNLRLEPEFNKQFIEKSLLPVSKALTSTFQGTVVDSVSEIMSIPTSVSPHWYVVGAKNSSPQLINGWKQAWQVTAGTYTVVYLGNLVVYAGVTLGLISLLIAFWWLWRRR